MFLVVAKASPKLQCMSSFLAELSLLSQKFEPYLPSRVAASAVFLARWTLDPSQNPWDQSLEEFTTYKAHDLRSVVFDLQALQRRQTEYNLWTRIYNKYSQPKVWKKDFLFIFFLSNFYEVHNMFFCLFQFQNVAALYSDDLVDTMFWQGVQWWIPDMIYWCV
jgi:hypothetical protein